MISQLERPPRNFDEEGELLHWTNHGDTFDEE